MPYVKRWNYDDNEGEKSIELFHVHVYIETIPYIYQPSEKDKEDISAENKTCDENDKNKI